MKHLQIKEDAEHIESIEQTVEIVVGSRAGHRPVYTLHLKSSEGQVCSDWAHGSTIETTIEQFVSSEHACDICASALKSEIEYTGNSAEKEVEHPIGRNTIEILQEEGFVKNAAEKMSWCYAPVAGLAGVTLQKVLQYKKDNSHSRVKADFFCDNCGKYCGRDYYYPQTQGVDYKCGNCGFRKFYQFDQYIPQKEHALEYIESLPGFRNSAKKISPSHGVENELDTVTFYDPVEELEMTQIVRSEHMRQHKLTKGRPDCGSDLTHGPVLMIVPSTSEIKTCGNCERVVQ